MVVYTLGHSTRTLEELVRVLRGCGVQTLVDVRTVPRSRTNPQFNSDVLPAALRAVGIEYVHEAGLGGLRSPTTCSRAASRCGTSSARRALKTPSRRRSCGSSPTAPSPTPNRRDLVHRLDRRPLRKLD
jgi:hypothetical protein